VAGAAKLLVDEQGPLQAGPSLGQRPQVVVDTSEMVQQECDLCPIGRTVPLRDDDGMLETRPDSGQIVGLTDQAAAGLAICQVGECCAFDVWSMPLAGQLPVHMMRRRGDAE
jgi:hypothetical protein